MGSYQVPGILFRELFHWHFSTLQGSCHWHSHIKMKKLAKARQLESSCLNLGLCDSQSHPQTWKYNFSFIWNHVLFILSLTTSLDAIASTSLGNRHISERAGWTSPWWNRRWEDWQQVSGEQIILGVRGGEKWCILTTVWALPVLAVCHCSLLTKIWGTGE